ncbi:MAG: cytochrome D1 domain-containing protein [Pseudomonadota bacterium]
MKPLLFVCLCLFSLSAPAQPRGSGDLGVVVERASGQLLIVEHSHDTRLAEIDGLGDLSHASVVFSRDARYAYVFGRDGGLTKVDLLGDCIEKRILQSGNSIGGAISQDGRLVAVSNYEPGGVRVFDADTLEPVADIPAEYAPGKRSKVVGLVDAPGNRFVFSLYDADQIWIADLSDPHRPALTRFENIGRAPYDALITPDGRYYIAGLFGEDSLALLDLWHPERGVHKILAGYAAHDEQLPVYKMPHLEGWALAGRTAFVPAVGQHKVLVVNTDTWLPETAIEVHGQPVFVMARPDGRQVWVNFAHPDNDTVQVIDVESRRIIRTLKPGKAVLHMEFTPRGEKLWLSVRDDDRIDVYDTATLERTATLPAHKPSGIFFTDRAQRIGL